MSESRLLDMSECGGDGFRSIHAEMLRVSLRLQPAWFRPLLVRSRHLKLWTGYDHWSRAWEYPWAIQAGDLQERRLRTLDVGGGGSPFAIYLAQRGHESVVVDPSLDQGISSTFDSHRSVYRNVRSLAKRVIFSVAGIHSVWGLPADGVRAGARYFPHVAHRLEFPDHHFDRVFCLSVMEHIPRDIWVNCIREFERVLKPGGRLVITLDMETSEANDRLYRKLVDSCSLSLLGNPDYETPLRTDDQQRRHPGQGYETIGLVWRK
jgi:SAM-dependent methyltransferase